MIEQRDDEMILRLTAKVYFTFIFCLMFSGCVSVNVGAPDATKAVKVELNPPALPFNEVRKNHADRFWLSDKTGNSISYLSECESSQDPTLSQVLNGFRQSLTDSQVLSEEKLLFNQRAALKAQMSGFVDGVESRIEALIFKKNNCLYVLTYIGVPVSFDEERAQFGHFLDGFRAP